MTGEPADFQVTFHPYEKPLVEELFEAGAGATPVWMYIWDGRPGPATVIPYAMVTDGEGGGFLEATGPAQPVTIVDDTDPSTC